MDRSLNASDYMTAQPVTVKPDTDIMAVIDLLLEHKISGASVVDANNVLVGVISEFDCLKAVLDASYYGEIGGTAQDYMTKEVELADPNADILALAKQMLEHKRRRLPVIKDGHFAGQFSARSVLMAISKYRARFAKK